MKKILIASVIIASFIACTKKNDSIAEYQNVSEVKASANVLSFKVTATETNGNEIDSPIGNVNLK